MDITEFIAARLAEDEAEANEVHRPGNCGCVDRDGSFSPDPVWCGCGYPARVLRRVEWTRHALNTIASIALVQPSAAHCLLTELAMEWSDYPDYRAEWKP